MELSDKMYDHFKNVSVKYTQMRPTDDVLIQHIQKIFENKENIRGADIGCGSGLYDLLLLQSIAGLQLQCCDVNEGMVEETARYLEDHDQKNFSVHKIDANDLSSLDDRLDFILTTNAIQHFDPFVFLDQASSRLKSGGYIFVYTRLLSQNARNIWGRFFPKFTEKETRFYDLGQIEAWINQFHDELVAKNIDFFRFTRTASLEELIHFVKSKHYSVFSLYDENELENALNEFIAQLQRHFTDINHIEWTDEDSLIVLQKK